MGRHDVDRKQAEMEIKKRLSLFLGKGVKEEDRENVIEETQRIIGDVDSSFAVRKLGAQVLLKLGVVAEGPMDAATLVAYVEEADLKRFTEFLLSFVEKVESKGVLLTDESLALYTCIVQRCAKMRGKLSERLERETVREVGRVLMDEGMKFCANRPEDLSHLVKAVLKFMCATGEEFEKLFDYVMMEYPEDLSPKYLLLSMIIPNISEEKLLSHLPHLSSALSSLSSSQSGCGWSAPTVVTLCTVVNNEQTRDLIYHSLTSQSGATRVNTSRYWLGRLTGNPKLRPFLKKVLERCVQGLQEKDDIWPPCTSSEYESVSCVSADWSWREAEEVVWKRDALMQAMLTITNVLLSTQTKRDDAIIERELFLAALHWHSASVRLAAFQLLLVCETKEKIAVVNDIDYESEIEKYIIVNMDTENGDEYAAIQSAAMKKEKWTEDSLTFFQYVLTASHSVPPAHSISPLHNLLPHLTDPSEESILLSMECLGDKVNVWDLWKLLSSGHESVRNKAIRLITKKMEDSEEREKIEKEVEKRRENGIFHYNDPILDVFAKVIGPDECRKMVEKEGVVEYGIDSVSFLLRFLSWGGHVTIEEHKRVIRRIEELLIVSGSKSLNECPQFPCLYAELEKNGWDQKEFAQLMVLLCTLLVRLKVSPSLSPSAMSQLPTLSSTLFSVSVRCRHKAVVDNVTALWPQVLNEENTMEVFDKTFSCLLSGTSQARTLSLSKTIWACCQNRPEFCDRLWEGIKSAISQSTSASITKIRALKTLKYFLVRENCPFATPDNLEFLFFYCIDLQTSDEEFLVKSAGTILYGFVVALLVHRREKMYLFEVIGTLPSLWKRVRDMGERLEHIPLISRVLFFSFLSRLSLGSERFYSEKLLREISQLSASLCSLLSHTGDARERRFVVECIAGLVPYSESSSTIDRCSTSLEQSSSWIERQTMAYLEYSLKGETIPQSFHRIPTDILCRPYVQKVEEFVRCVEEKDDERLIKLINSLEDTKFTHELPANTYAYCIGIVGMRMREIGLDIHDDPLVHSGVSDDSSPSSLPSLSRDLRNLWIRSLYNCLVRGGKQWSIACRGMVEAGLTPYYLQPLQANLQYVMVWNSRWQCLC